MNSTEFRWFYAGTALLALVIGALIGVSASPVVGVTVPLLFALLSAGGALYVVLGKDEPATTPTPGPADAAAAPAAHPPPLSPRQRRQRAAFLGKQFIAFAAGILVGVWIGVWVKLHSENVWGIRPNQEAAIIELDFTDARDLASTLVLDERLIAAHVPLDKRHSLLTKLHEAVANRRGKDDQSLASDDASAALAVLNALTKKTQQTEEKKSDDIGPVAIEDFSAAPPDIKKLLTPQQPTG